MTALRVVIADDHQLVRTGFRLILGAAGIDVVAEAATGVVVLDPGKARYAVIPFVVATARRAAFTGFSGVRR